MEHYGRVPIVRQDEDGTVIDGTAALVIEQNGSTSVRDFRDLNGTELTLPPGSRFEIPIDLPIDRD